MTTYDLKDKLEDMELFVTREKDNYWRVETPNKDIYINFGVFNIEISDGEENDSHSVLVHGYDEVLDLFEVFFKISSEQIMNDFFNMGKNEYREYTKYEIDKKEEDNMNHKFIINVNAIINDKFTVLGNVSKDNVMDDPLNPNELSFTSKDNAEKWLESEDAKSWINENDKVKLSLEIKQIL